MALSMGIVVASGTLLGLVAGALYLRARGKPTGFGFSAFQVKRGWGCVGAGSFCHVWGLTSHSPSSRQKIMPMMTSPHGKKGPAQPWFLSPTLSLAATMPFVSPLM